MLRTRPKPEADPVRAPKTPRIIYGKQPPKDSAPRPIANQDAYHYNVHMNVAFEPRPPLDQGLPTPPPSRPVSPAAPEPVRDPAYDAYVEVYRAWLEDQVRVPNAPYVAPPEMEDPIQADLRRQFGEWLLPEAAVARQQAAGRQFMRACQAGGHAPGMTLETLQTLHRVHATDMELRALFGHDRRTAALRVLMEVCDIGAARDPDDVLRDARAMPWTRLIEFSCAEGLGGLTDSLVTGALAAATYQAGIACGQKAAQAKAAGVTLKAAGFAAGATATGVVSGLGAAATGWYAVNSVRVHYKTIQAFRDVWDNGFSRDAFFVHKLRDHVLAGRMSEENEPYCKHLNSDWTDPHTKFRAKWKQDYRGFSDVK